MMLCVKHVSSVTFLVLISTFIPLLPAWSGPRPRACCGEWEPLLGSSRGIRARLIQRGESYGWLDVDDRDNTALHPRDAMVGARMTFVGSLGLRGGGFLDEEGSLGYKDPNERRQTRKLGLAKEKWKRKYRGENHFESSDLSDEDEDDEDRPDVYKKPKLPPPPDDWNPDGDLPAWMDPIYDEEDAQDAAFEADLQDDDSDGSGKPASSLSTDTDGIYYNETSRGICLTDNKKKRYPHDTDFDKELTFSECEEMFRIWGVPQFLQEFDQVDSEYLEWPEEEPIEIQALEAGPPVDEVPRSTSLLNDAERHRPSLRDDDHDDHDDHNVGDGHGHGDVQGLGRGQMAASSALTLAGEPKVAGDEGGDGINRGSREVVVPPGGRNDVVGEGMFLDSDDDDDAEESRTQGKMVNGAVGSGGGERDDAPPNYDPDRHPLEYQFDVDGAREEMEGLRFADVLRDHDWSKEKDPEKARRERELDEMFLRRWGFIPDPQKDIPGFNTWNTTAPLPLVSRAANPEKEHHIVPDVHKTLPLALSKCQDGDTVFVRRGNHTWLGEIERDYDVLATREHLWTDDQLGQLIGYAVVPPEGLSRASLDLIDTHVLDHVFVDDDEAGTHFERDGHVRGKGEDLDDFCLHVTGEEGARLCGRWFMRQHTCGSIKGVECIFQVNETEIETNAGICLGATLDVHGGPWLFESVAIRSCGGIGIICSRQSLAKCRGCAIGGISHDRRMQAVMGRAMMGMQARDFSRVVVEMSTFEMTGLFFMPAAQFIGKSKASVNSCLIQRSTHAVGVLDRTEVCVSNCTIREMNQGALWCPRLMGPVADEDGEGVAGKMREHDRMKEYCGVGQEVYWDDQEREYVTSRPQETIRFDPIFGNVTDGWTRGLPGWTNGAPAHVKRAVDVSIDVDGACMSEIPDSEFQWGKVGCVKSHLIANGTLPGDTLAYGYTGGGHESSLQVWNCTIFGRIWSTMGRPAKLRMRRILNPRDPWVDLYLGNETERPTSRMLLEDVGMQWDAKRRMWRKPVRIINGSVVYVDWNETRFQSDGAPGGYPGHRGWYPMFDANTGERLDSVLTCCDVVETIKFPLMNDRIHVLPAEGQKRLEKLRKKAARRKREEAIFEGHDPVENDPALAALALMDPEKKKQADIRRLIRRFLERKHRVEPLWQLDDPNWHMLDDQEVPPMPDEYTRGILRTSPTY